MRVGLFEASSVAITSNGYEKTQTETEIKGVFVWR